MDRSATGRSAADYAPCRAKARLGSAGFFGLAGDILTQRLVDVGLIPLAALGVAFEPIEDVRIEPQRRLLLEQPIHHAPLGILEEVIIQAAESHLTPTSFALLWRKRLIDADYLEHLLEAVEATGNKARLTTLCDTVARRLQLPRFRQRFLELTGTENPGAAPGDDAQPAL